MDVERYRQRSGAWNLDPDAPEAKKGFLLNHVISELLLPKENGYGIQIPTR